MEECDWCNPECGVWHRPVLTDLIVKYGWRRGAELGICHGYLLEHVLTNVPDLSMIGVDCWAKYPERAASAYAVAERFPGRCIIHRSDTHNAAALVPNGSLDFVFVDADHSYKSVKRDIADWRSKVRRGGCMTGHDYDRKKFPGVVRAVKEAFGIEAIRKQAASIWLAQL